MFGKHARMNETGRVMRAIVPDGPPVRIQVTGEFKRKWVAEHFGAALARCYGETIVEAA